MEYFDFNEKKWRTVAPMIIPRKYAGSAILDGQLYAVGGVNREYADLVTVESYNPCVGQWTSVASLNKCKGDFYLLNTSFANLRPGALSAFLSFRAEGRDLCGWQVPIWT